MSNSLKDLNAFLFAQLDRLDVEKLSAEDIEREAQRAEAVVAVADKITANFDLQLRAAKLFAEHREAILPYLPQIGAQPVKPE
jgi:hypothetical protein